MCDLNNLGKECDNAIDFNRLDLLKEKIDKLSLCLIKANSDFDKIHINYFLANLFAAKSRLCRENPYIWANDKCPENLIEEINHLRKAYNLSGNTETSIKFEIQTNLANTLSVFGRYIEAIKLWLCDFSLAGDNPFVSSYSKSRALRVFSSISRRFWPCSLL